MVICSQYLLLNIRVCVGKYRRHLEMGNLGLIKSICCLTNDRNVLSRESLMLKELITHKKFSNKALLEQARTHV